MTSSGNNTLRRIKYPQRFPGRGPGFSRDPLTHFDYARILAKLNLLLSKIAQGVKRNRVQESNCGEISEMLIGFLKRVLSSKSSLF